MKLEKIGRQRLQLRLPAYRNLLSEMKSPSMSEIFSAYAEASIQLDALRTSEVPDPFLAEEYERICLQIENSIEPYLRMFNQNRAKHAKR